MAGPTVEPLTLPECVAHLKLPEEQYAPTPNAEGDAELSSFIAAVRQHVEDRTRRALLEQTWQLRLPAFPEAPSIRLPKPPLLSVESVTYTPVTGGTATLAPELYEVETGALYGAVHLAPGASWPQAAPGLHAVRVTFRAGYGDEPDDVPAALRHAMKLLLGHWWMNREAVIVGTIAQAAPLAVDSLLATYLVPEGA